ncbi:MAG: hypothetical protein MK078_17270 [Crocinitomicaceae bacterium]|nr:hypothetical protein [Crocinitomicaceae bacterium]
MGFNPKNDPRTKWVEPKSSITHETLTPWIDWWNGASIGYGKHGAEFFIVKSNWQPSPNTHLREEVAELINHEVVPISAEGLRIDTSRLIQLHDQLPTGEKTLII